MPVIGFLNSRASGENPAILAAFRRGFERGRLCRGPERHGRIPLGRRPIRPTTGVGGRSGWPASGRNRRKWPRRTDSKVSNFDTTDRLRGRLRPACFWTCRQPEPAGRQSHWCERLGRGDRGEAARVTARVDPHGDYNCFTRQPDDSRCRNRNKRRAGSCPRPRGAAASAWRVASSEWCDRKHLAGEASLLANRYSFHFRFDIGRNSRSGAPV